MAAPTLAGLRHLDLCVSDLERSLEFYCELLGKLDWDVTPPQSEISGEQDERVIYLLSSSDPGLGALGLRAARDNLPMDRYRVGLHHLAFNAASRHQVDEVWDWVQAKNLEHEGPPRDYYDGPYYAIFFRDPDAIKLEVVHRPYPTGD
jgi:catechol 2,3-dioxygenase-like lactoylglutathione lyase family enzyme